MRSILIKIIDTFSFFIYFLIKEDLINYFGRRCTENVERDKVVHILANGPSLNDSLREFENNLSDYKHDDFCCVNYLANEKIFLLLQPRYYVLSDVQFFREGHVKSKAGMALVEKLNDIVKWKMYMFLPYHFKKYVSSFTNPNITVVLLHSRRYIGFERLRFWYYRHGLGNGEFGTVVQNAIYSMVTLGYKTINLYGVDHNYFNGLVVMNDNKLYYRYQHSFDTSEPELTPIIFGTDQNISVSKFLMDFGYLFKGHEILNEYANTMGCTITNCTPGSFIDSYKRKI